MIFDDCDIARAVASATTSSLGNAGQDCCARSRILVQQSISDEFTKQLVAAFEKVNVGNPLDESTDMGPLITTAHRDRVMSYIESGKSEGATIATGGTCREGCFVAPTVLTDVNPEMRVVRDEIFGPVVTLSSFTDEADAIAQANDTHYGLSGSIWTRDIGRALRVARAIESGNLSINSGSSVHLEAPFGGVKRSGIGRELGMQVLENYTE